MDKTIERIGKAGLVPVVVLEKASDAVPTAKALLAGGVDIMEITMRTDAAIDAIKAVREEIPEMLVGAGTVLSQEMVRLAVDAGSKFIVSPGLNPKVACYCKSINVPIIPGCVTPTEIEQALELGINILKFFPAGMYGGVSGCKNLFGPYKMVKFVPTGGVDLSNLAEYVDKPYIHAVGGSWLCSPTQIARAEFEEITKACRESVKILLGFDCENPGNEEETINIDRAIYHLLLAGYEQTSDCTFLHTFKGKQLKIN